MGFKKIYIREAEVGLKRKSGLKTITPDDIRHLPAILQKYLNFTGVIGKPQTNNIRLRFAMKLRSKPDAPWMTLKVQQFSFFDIPTRLFHMKASMMGIPATGLHHYHNGNATMEIKLFSLIPVIKASGNEMNVSETVTFFNDMCCLAPATLLNKTVRWTEVDNLSVTGELMINGITVSARLIFKETGELVNFISEDRYCYMPDGTFKKFRFTTPLGNFREYNGILLPSTAKAVWDYPEGEFCYGEFELLEAACNSPLKVY